MTTLTKTCRAYTEGKMYFHPRRKEHATVPRRHIVLACEACEYVVSLSTRVYEGPAVDMLRRQHLQRVHSSALRSGAISLQE